MKTYIKGLIILVISLLCLIIIEQLLPAGYPDNHYLYSIKYKDSILKAETAGKRILIAGGSNTAFGIDSETIEKSLDRKTINLGVHGGLRYEFIINQIIPNIRNEDIIVLIPEYEHFYSPLSLKNKNFITATVLCPEIVNYFSYDQRIEATVKRFTASIQSKFSALFIEKKDHFYPSSCFNEYGDFICHLGKKPEFIKKGFKDYRNENLSADFIDLTNKIVVEAKKKNAKVYFMFPPVAKSYVSSKIGKNIDLIYSIPDIKVLNSIGYHYPDTMYFDTEYHLNREGRKKRTEALLNSLQTDSLNNSIF